MSALSTCRQALASLPAVCNHVIILQATYVAVVHSTLRSIFPKSVHDTFRKFSRDRPIVPGIPQWLTAGIYTG